MAKRFLEKALRFLETTAIRPLSDVVARESKGNEVEDPNRIIRQGLCIILLFFGVSYMLLVWLDYSQWAFDRFVNPNIGVATGRGLYNKDKPREGTRSSVSPSASQTEPL